MDTQWQSFQSLSNARSPTDARPTRSRPYVNPDITSETNDTQLRRHLTRLDADYSLATQNQPEELLFPSRDTISDRATNLTRRRPISSVSISQSSDRPRDRITSFSSSGSARRPEGRDYQFNSFSNRSSSSHLRERDFDTPPLDINVPGNFGQDSDAIASQTRVLRDASSQEPTTSSSFTVNSVNHESRAHAYSSSVEASRAIPRPLRAEDSPSLWAGPSRPSASIGIDPDLRARARQRAASTAQGPFRSPSPPSVVDMVSYPFPETTEPSSSSAGENIDPSSYHDGPFRATLQRYVDLERIRSRLRRLEAMTQTSISESSPTTRSTFPNILPPVHSEVDDDLSVPITVPHRSTSSSREDVRFHVHPYLKHVLNIYVSILHLLQMGQTSTSLTWYGKQDSEEAITLGLLHSQALRIMAATTMRIPVAVPSIGKNENYGHLGALCHHMLGRTSVDPVQLTLQYIPLDVVV